MSKFGSLFGGGAKSSPPPVVVAPPPPPPVPLPDDEAARKARRRKIAKAQNRSGRLSTILTDVTGSEGTLG